jgi:hypothetical protein
MRNKRHLTNSLLAVFCAVGATLFIIACQQSQQPAPAPAPPAETKAATNDIFVTFEGPWAIVPDPKDTNSVLAIAPKTKSHRFLAFVPGNTELDAGVYDLTLPAHAAAGAPTFDKGILRVNVDPQVVQHALDRRAERYAIRLPKPEAYVAETRFVSRVSATYPPDASTEQAFVTAVSLRYSASSKTGFQLAGTQDAGGDFKPLLLEVNTPVLRFTIDPVEIHLHDDPCHTHAREVFRDVTRLLGLRLYIDFPESPADCHKNDPQSRSEKAQLLNLPPMEQTGAFASSRLSQPKAAAILGSMSSAMHAVRQGLHAALYFFHAEGGGCTVPIPVGG